MGWGRTFDKEFLMVARETVWNACFANSGVRHALDERTVRLGIGAPGATIRAPRSPNDGSLRTASSCLVQYCRMGMEIPC